MSKNELIEIKKGKTGTGLLIDNDGYITLNEGHNKTIKEGMNNGEWNVPYPLSLMRSSKSLTLKMLMEEFTQKMF